MSSQGPKFDMVPRLAERQPTPAPIDDALRTVHLLVDVFGTEGQHDLSLIFKQVEMDDYLRNRCGNSLLDRPIDGLLQ
jgi:hypothetical protein